MLFSLFVHKNTNIGKVVQLGLQFVTLHQVEAKDMHPD